MRSELAEKESQQLDAYLQALRNQLNSQRQLEAERALESTELLAENSADLPKDIVAQSIGGTESTGAADGSRCLATASGCQPDVTGPAGVEYAA